MKKYTVIVFDSTHGKLTEYSLRANSLACAKSIARRLQCEDLSEFPYRVFLAGKGNDSGWIGPVCLPLADLIDSEGNCR